MKLHYSQTRGICITLSAMFYYLMKLHYSQTKSAVIFSPAPFYYLMKLHYSQTRNGKEIRAISFTTLWNYTILKPGIYCSDCVKSFTTLWNYTILKPTLSIIALQEVLLPYEITLFSNWEFGSIMEKIVLLPYEITLFSNLKIENKMHPL